MASIRYLIEHAFKDWLDGEGLSATVFTGVSAATKSLPAVIVRLADATEEPIYSGNYNCTVEVRIESAASSGETAHEALCTAARNLIWADDLKANLETAGALTVFGAAAPHKVEYDTEEDTWIERHTVDLYCAARVFPA